MYPFPFIVTAGLYIPHVTEGLSRQYENRTSTPIKASQKGRTRKKCNKVKKH